MFAGEQMSKAKFEIGDNEKHQVFVNANPLLKFIRIEVDGERVVNVANFQPSRKFDLEVGEKEKHKLEIHVRALTPTKLLVDGEEVPPV